MRGYLVDGHDRPVRTVLDVRQDRSARVKALSATVTGTALVVGVVVSPVAGFVTWLAGLVVAGVADALVTEGDRRA